MAESYDKGDVLRITGTFRNAAGAAIDPSGVFFAFKTPLSGTVTTYTYPIDTQIQRISQGVYAVDLRFTASGRWMTRLYSTGVGEASEEREYSVRPSAF